MTQLLQLLAGKKTYISAFLAVLLPGLKAAGIIDDAQFQALLVLLGGCGLASLRSALNNK